MPAYRAVIIGTGPTPDDPGPDGYGMGYRHADAYRDHPDCELVACADIVPEHGQAFADEYDLPSDAVFESHEELLHEVEPHIVSITVPPAVHADLAEDCLQSESVAAVHCEKPMADTWANCERMVDAANETDTVLTFNHQRRFARPIRKAKELLDAGEIGDLERVEFGANDLYDYGSHSFDLCGYFVDECRAEWVLAQVDYREENLLFGAHNENQAVAQWRYENGVRGFATTGFDADLVDCHNRLVGTDGVIEIGGDVPLRVRRDGEGWETIDCGESCHNSAFIGRAIADVVDSIEGEPSELRADVAIRGTELIFGAWESSRKRGRVDFPLSIDDNPLEAMVESGALNPASH